MKGKIKKLFSSILCALVVLSFLAQPMCTMAAEVKSNVSTNEVQYMDIVVNPEYADILDIEALRAQRDEIKALRDHTSTYATSSIHATVDAAAAELREKMVKRENFIEVKMTYDVYLANVSTGTFKVLFDKALEHTEACSGQEGDALDRVWTYYSAGFADDGNGMILTAYIEYMTTYEQEVALTKAVDKAIASLNMENDDEYTKVYKIYNYICDNVDYDFANLNDNDYMLKYTAYAALCNGTAVCQGYAVLFYRMCKEVGLSVRYISGYSYGESHGWNIVRIGDYYYNVDSTWDGQDAVTYSRYFLKNMEDFTNHDRKDKYMTEQFMAEYPMASLSWTDFNSTSVKLNKNNYSATFNTIDGSTVSTTANGRPKVLLFYSDLSSYSSATIQSIRDGKLAGVDVVAINSIKSDIQTVKEFKEKYGNDSIAFTYDTTSTSNNYLMSYIYLVGLEKESNLSYPLIVYIDKNNVVQYASHGYCDVNTIKYNLGYYCDSNVLELAETSKALDKGATYKISVYWLGEKMNNAQVKWTTSDAKVATVDANGVITAVGGGTCTITGNANNKYSVSMNVTVLQKKLDAPQFSVSNVAGGVQIKWNFVDDATGYIIYRREAGGTFSKIAGFTDGVTRSYVDKNVVDGKAYFYAVKAVNSSAQSEYTTKGINYKAMLATPTFTVENASGGVRINWNFVDGATGYIIYRREAGGTFSKIAGFTDGKTKSYLDTNLVDGKAYFYAVKAINSTTQSEYTTKGINYKAMLAIPTFTVANVSGGVQIKWDFVDGATGYIVYRREAGGVFQKIAGFMDGKTKSYTDKNVVNGTAYFYAVKAINGTTQSEYTTKGINYKASLATPSFTIANVAGGVQIKWEFVDDAIGYIIYRREAGGTFSKIAGFTDGKTKSYVDTNVVDGKAYFYAVKAVNNTTQSTYNTQGINYKASLAAPTFTVTKVTDGVQVNWNFVDGATGYIVYRRDENGTFQKIAGFTDGTTKSYVDKTAVKGTTYYYAVKAINSTTQSTYNSVEIIP